MLAPYISYCPENQTRLGMQMLEHACGTAKLIVHSMAEFPRTSRPEQRQHQPLLAQ